MSTLFVRCALETYLWTTYPLYFREGEWLGEMVGNIRESGAAHVTAFLYDELDRINDYTSSYHHGENLTDATLDQIDSIELEGFIQRTLRIVKAMPV